MNLIWLSDYQLFQACRTSVSKWDYSLYFWWNVIFLSNSFPWIQMLPMLKTCTFPILKNVCCSLALHLLKIGPISFALDHSLCARMTVTWTKGVILWRCLSPYHRHQWQICLCAEWTKRLVVHSQVSPLLVAAHSTSSEAFDIHIWCFPRAFWCNRGKHVRIPYAASRDQIHHRLRFCCDSFFTCIFFAFFSTSLQDNWWNWNGWCWTNTNDDSIHHVWNFPLSVCLRVGFWCQCIWFGFLVSKLILSNNQSRATLWVLETCLIVGLLPFMIILITASSSSDTYNKASWREELTFEEIKSTLSRSSIVPWDYLSFLKFVRCCTNLTLVRARVAPFLITLIRVSVKNYDDPIGFQLFFFFEMMVINAWSWCLVELLSRLVCQLTISFHTFLGMTLHVIRPRRNTQIFRAW